LPPSYSRRHRKTPPHGSQISTLRYRLAESFVPPGRPGLHKARQDPTLQHSVCTSTMRSQAVPSRWAGGGVEGGGGKQAVLRISIPRLPGPGNGWICFPRDIPHQSRHLTTLSVPRSETPAGRIGQGLRKPRLAKHFASCLFLLLRAVQENVFPFAGFLLTKNMAPGSLREPASCLREDNRIDVEGFGPPTYAGLRALCPHSTLRGPSCFPGSTNNELDLI